jgi:hypothetical protein
MLAALDVREHFDNYFTIVCATNGCGHERSQEKSPPNASKCKNKSMSDSHRKLSKQIVIHQRNPWLVCIFA